MRRPNTRMVHSSTGHALRLTSGSSYSPSLRSHGLPSRQNILCCVFIAVMVAATLGTTPLAHGQRQALDDVATVETPLARWIETITHQQLSPVPSAFVSQKLSELSKRGIRDRFCEAVVSHHAANMEILNRNDIETLNEVRCHLVDVVESRVGNLRLNASNPESLTFPAPATLTPSSKDLLRPRELLFYSPCVAQVGDVFPVRESGEARDPEIDANRFPSRRQRRDDFIQNQCHKIPTGSVLGYCHRRRVTRECSRPAHAEPAEFGKVEVLILSVPFERRSCVFSGLLSVFTFECWVFSPSLEEVDERSLQMSECLLRRNAGNFSKKRKFCLSLQFRQLGRCVGVADIDPFGIGIGTKAKHMIVHEPATPKRTGEDYLLLIGWVAPEPISEFHMFMIAYVKDSAKLSGSKHSSIA